MNREKMYYVAKMSSEASNMYYTIKMILNKYASVAVYKKCR